MTVSYSTVRIEYQFSGPETLRVSRNPVALGGNSTCRLAWLFRGHGSNKTSPHDIYSLLRIFLNIIITIVTSNVEDD